MTPQPQSGQAQSAGVGHAHPWRGKTHRAVGTQQDPDAIVYSTEKPPPEPERKLLAIGGEGGRPERRLEGLRVWSDKYQETLPLASEVATWFVRHLAEAAKEQRDGHDGSNGNGARDPQLLLNSPGANYTNLENALKYARARLQEEQEAAKKALDNPLPGL